MIDYRHSLSYLANAYLSSLWVNRAILPKITIMKTTITPYLQTTKELIQRAFPRGIQPDVYFSLLTILEPSLSDRHLALIIANLTDKEYSQVLNDIYQIKSHPLNNSELLQSVQSQLNASGYQDWLEQD